MNDSLILNNPNRHIGRIKQESNDFSYSNHIGTIERIKKDIESLTVVTSLQNSRAGEIEKIINEKELLIDERNKILNNFFKSFFYRKELRKIDIKLDTLDLQLYLLETENSIKKSDLDLIISTAEARLGKYSKYTPTK